MQGCVAGDALMRSAMSNMNPEALSVESNVRDITRHAYWNRSRTHIRRSLFDG
ncbi:5150_t:CDS:2 [Rhizophagus irregularis]|nr:5150_t:CDS:2 [Rhizophagus irregularis]